MRQQRIIKKGLYIEMEIHEKLGQKFCSAPLGQWQLELAAKPMHGSLCLIIAENLSDADEIQAQVFDLLSVGCRWFVFGGKHGELWQYYMSGLYRESQLDGEDAWLLFSKHCETAEDFAKDLSECVRARKFLPYDTVVLYDDRSAFEKALALVE